MPYRTRLAACLPHWGRRTRTLSVPYRIAFRLVLILSRSCYPSTYSLRWIAIEPIWYGVIVYSYSLCCLSQCLFDHGSDYNTVASVAGVCSGCALDVLDALCSCRHCLEGLVPRRSHAGADEPFLIGAVAASVVPASSFCIVAVAMAGLFVIGVMMVMAVLMLISGCISMMVVAMAVISPSPSW